jgi:acyl-CoA thioester hydrolase
MNDPLPQHTLELRVRYNECDPMGLAHHATYPVWMEMARTELLRSRGIAYTELEAAGVYIVVARLNISYRQAARYDDCLQITARLQRITDAKIEHDYTIHRDGQLICTASTVLGCVDRQGRIQRVPTMLQALVDAETTAGH